VKPVDPVDNLGKHPIPTVPPSTVASPHRIDFGTEPERWWKPSWGAAWKYMGWRWLLFVPMAILVSAVVMCFIWPIWMGWVWNLAIILGKITVLIIALPFMAAGYALSSAVAARKDPFCIHCGYGLEGLPDHHRCPECGMQYSWATIEEYRRDPKWFIHRWRERRGLPANFGSFEAGPVRSAKRRDGT
jgi:hypothetical protein